MQPLNAKLVANSIAKTPGLITLAASICFLFNIVIRFPGVANFDSDAQYAQAVSGHYTDWHPPIMAWLWSTLRLFADGNGTLFVLHVFFYWLGFGLIAIALNRSGRNRAAWGVTAISVFPAFLMMNVQLLKDVGLAATLLLSFAICFWYRSKNKKIPTTTALIAIVLLFYGVMVRTNGIFAAAPLLVYMFYPALFRRPVRLILGCLAIMALAIPVSGAFNHIVLRATPLYPIRSLEIFDLAGISFYSNDTSVFGDGNSFTKQEVSECYTPELWDSLGPGGKCDIFWNALGTTDLTRLQKDHRSSFQDPPNPSLTKIWISAIIQHPYAYAEHRMAHFNSALDFIVPQHHADRRVLNWIVYRVPLDVEHFTLIRKIIDRLKFNPFFTPIFSLLLGFSVLVFLFSRPTARPSQLKDATFCLLLSGLFYTFGYLFVGVSSDFRYQFWSMMAFFVATAIYMPEQKLHFVPSSRLGWTCIGIMVFTFMVTLAARIMEGDALFPMG